MVSIAQNRGRFEKTLQRAFAIPQLLDVGNLLVRFQGKLEAARHTLCPLHQQALGRHAVKRMVDLDGREVLAVEAKHFAVGKLLRVEASFPLFIGVARRARAQLY